MSEFEDGSDRIVLPPGVAYDLGSKSYLKRERAAEYIRTSLSPDQLIQVGTDVHNAYAAKREGYRQKAVTRAYKHLAMFAMQRIVPVPELGPAAKAKDLATSYFALNALRSRDARAYAEAEEYFYNSLSSSAQFGLRALESYLVMHDATKEQQ